MDVQAEQEVVDLLRGSAAKAMLYIWGATNTSQPLLIHITHPLEGEAEQVAGGAWHRGSAGGVGCRVVVVGRGDRGSGGQCDYTDT